jgi:hypothetical protein
LLYQLSYAPALYNQALAAVISDAWERMGTIISMTSAVPLVSVA